MFITLFRAISGEILFFDEPTNSNNNIIIIKEWFTIVLQLGDETHCNIQHSTLGSTMNFAIARSGTQCKTKFSFSYLLELILLYKAKIYIGTVIYVLDIFQRSFTKRRKI